MPLNSPTDEPNETSPLLIGILVDVSFSMTESISNKASKEKNRLRSFRDALESFAKRARDLSSRGAGSQGVPRVKIFAYGFGFGGILSPLTRDVVRDLFCLKGIENTTIGADFLADNWSTFQDHFEQLALEMFGSTPMAEGLATVLERFRAEEKFPKWYSKLLFILSDGEPDEYSSIPRLVEQLKSDGVIIISCYVTDEDVGEPHTLYSTAQPGWPAGANLLFECSSELSETSPYILHARERRWKAPAGARLFLQVNNSELLEEFLQFALSPIDHVEDPQ